MKYALSLNADSVKGVGDMNSSDVMQRVSFYEAICEANINAENWLLTVVDGDHAGEKAMISSGEFVWRSDDGGFVMLSFSETGKKSLSAGLAMFQCRSFQ